MLYSTSGDASESAVVVITGASASVFVAEEGYTVIFSSLADLSYLKEIYSSVFDDELSQCRTLVVLLLHIVTPLL